MPLIDQINKSSPTLRLVANNYYIVFIKICSSPSLERPPLNQTKIGLTREVVLKERWSYNRGNFIQQITPCMKNVVSQERWSPIEGSLKRGGHPIEGSLKRNGHPIGGLSRGVITQ